MAGHPGQDKTYLFIKLRCYWPQMGTDINNYVSKCHQCKQRKSSPHLRKAPLQQFQEVSYPFERCCMDIVGPFITSNEGNKYLLTFQDYFTKYVEIMAIPDQTAKTISKNFFQHVISRFGTPEQLITDCGSNFIGELFTELCKTLGIKKLHTTPYHPQANPIERCHRVFKDFLSQYISKGGKDWDTWVPYLMMSYNFSIHSSSKYSPYFLLYGRDPILPMDLVLKPRMVKYNLDDNYVSELLARLHKVWQEAKVNLRTAAEKRAIQYNKKTKDVEFQIGDLVYLYDPATKIGQSRKLVKPWKGPFRIIEEKGPVTFKIRELNKNKEHIVHANRLKLCKGDFEDEEEDKEHYLAVRIDDSANENEEADESDFNGAANPQDVAKIILEGANNDTSMDNDQVKIRKEKRVKFEVSQKDKKLMESNRKKFENLESFGLTEDQGVKKSNRIRLKSQS